MFNSSKACLLMRSYLQCDPSFWLDHRWRVTRSRIWCRRHFSITSSTSLRTGLSFFYRHGIYMRTSVVPVLIGTVSLICSCLFDYLYGAFKNSLTSRCLKACEKLWVLKSFLKKERSLSNGETLVVDSAPLGSNMNLDQTSLTNLVYPLPGDMWSILWNK